MRALPAPAEALPPAPGGGGGMKAWRKERRGRGGGEKFAGIPVFWKRLLLSPAHPLKNHLL